MGSLSRSGGSNLCYCEAGDLKIIRDSSIAGFLIASALVAIGSFIYLVLRTMWDARSILLQWAFADPALAILFGSCAVFGVTMLVAINTD